MLGLAVPLGQTRVCGPCGAVANVYLNLVRAPEDEDVLGLPMGEHHKLCRLPRVLHLKQGVRGEFEDTELFKMFCLSRQGSYQMLSPRFKGGSYISIVFMRC